MLQRLRRLEIIASVYCPILMNTINLDFSTFFQKAVVPVCKLENRLSMLELRPRVTIPLRAYM